MDGVEAAAKVIDNAGGVLGRKVNVLPVNTQSDPVDAVTATRKMLAVDGCNVVQGLTAADWPGALPVIEQSHMVFLTRSRTRHSTKCRIHTSSGV